jgi:Xaa-Pro dipeptidase
MVDTAAARDIERFPLVETTDIETSIDMVRLRGYRLARLRRILAEKGFGACLLVDPISIRYATGNRNASLFQMHVPVRYAFIAVDGPVVLFDGESDRTYAERLETIADFRQAQPICFFFGGPNLERNFSH